MTLAGHAACLVLSALFLPLPAWSAGKPDLEALRARIEALRLDIAGTEDARSEAREELRESERSISSANRSLRELAEQREAARASVRSLAARKSAIAADIASRERELGAMLAAIYRQGKPSHIRLLLSGSDPNQTARNLHYVAHVLRAQSMFMDALRSDLADARAVEAEQLANTSQLAEIEAAQKKQRAELVEQQLARRKVLERVSARLNTQLREVRNLERDQSRLSRLVEGLTKVIASNPVARPKVNDKLPEPSIATRPFGNLKGSLRLPIKGVVANRYGNSPPSGGPAGKGLFIKGTSGDEVKAVATGRVVFAEWMRGFGNLLILDHGDDYLSIYGNNESLLRAVGDEVKAGDAIATVGASGGSQETGLYFEVRHEGKAFNPEKWLAAR